MLTNLKKCYKLHMLISRTFCKSKGFLQVLLTWWLTGLYSGIEIHVKCGGSLFYFFPDNFGVRQRCILAPWYFNNCMDWVIRKVADQSQCRAYISKIRMTNFFFCNSHKMAGGPDDGSWGAARGGEPLGLMLRSHIPEYGPDSSLRNV